MGYLLFFRRVRNIFFVDSENRIEGIGGQAINLLCKSFQDVVACVGVSKSVTALNGIAKRIVDKKLKCG